MIRASFKKAFPVTLPVMAGYLVLGFGFGALLSSAGYDPMLALLMSGFIYAGSMQYIAVSLLANGASLASAALLTFLINARHLFYGLSMLDTYRDLGTKKPYLIFSLTDETYSLLCTGDVPEGSDPGWHYFFVSSLNQLYWVLGSLIGSVAGSLLHIDFSGIEFSMTALFVVLFLERWLSSRNRIPAITGVLCSAFCLLLFGPERFILPSMVLIAGSLWSMRGKLPEAEAA